MHTALLSCKHDIGITKGEQYHKPFLKSQRPESFFEISSARKRSWQRTVEVGTTNPSRSMPPLHEGAPTIPMNSKRSAVPWDLS